MGIAFVISNTEMSIILIDVFASQHSVAVQLFGELKW